MTTLKPDDLNFLILYRSSLQCCGDGPYWRLRFRNAQTQVIVGPGAVTAMASPNSPRWAFAFTLAVVNNLPAGVFAIPQGYHYAELFNLQAPDDELPGKPCYVEHVYLPVTDKRVSPTGPLTKAWT